MFSQVDGLEAHGYVRMAPHRGDWRCTPVPCIGQNHGLGYQPTLQTMQDDTPSSQHGLLVGWGGSLRPTCYGGGSSVPGQAPAVPGGRDHLTGSSERFACGHGLHADDDAQAIGRTMGFMVVQQRYLWLTLADLKDSDRKVLLNTPITPSSLFGDAVESILSTGTSPVTVVTSVPWEREQDITVIAVITACPAKRCSVSDSGVIVAGIYTASRDHHICMLRNNWTGVSQ